MNGPALLGLALILDALMGEPRWLWSRLPHPAVLMGRAVSALDTALNSGAGRRAKGAIALSALAAGALLLGLLIAWAGSLAELLCAAILIAQRSLSDHVGAVSAGLRRSPEAGRQAVSMIVSRDCRDMDEARVARAAIESAAENLSDGVVAPAFWFLLFGAPGIVLYKAINTADSMIGYRNDRYEAFGKAAARADDLLNLIPARLTGALIALLTGQIGHWGDITADARRHRSPNAGWPEAAIARALNVALAGPRSYDGTLQHLAWVNDGARQDIGADDIDAATRILWRVWTAILALTFGLAILASLL